MQPITECKFMTLAPLVSKQRGRFSICRLDPGWEKVSLIRLEPQILVQICVSNLLERFDLVDWDEMGVLIHELYRHLLKGALGQQMTLYTGKRLVGIIISLTFILL